MNDKPREQSQLTINGFTFEVPEPWSKGELVIESIITHLDKPLRQNPPPDPELIESLRTWGQRVNIILSMRYLRENQEQREYHIIAGRRRLLAALRLGWATILATVYQLNPLLEQALVVDTNSTRSSDPVGEFEALVKLLDEGRKQGLNITNQMLHQATGLSSQTIKKRLMLAQLLPDLQDACFAGKLTVTTAEMACKLPPPPARPLPR